MNATEHTYELIADHGDGEQRSILERRDDGVICLTTNAESREPVTPSQFAGPGWDDLSTEEWLVGLTEQFGSEEAARVFVQAAGRELPETAIPDGMYFLFPEGETWTAAEFRAGKLVREAYEADAMSHAAAGDRWANVVPSDYDSEVRGDLATAIIRAALGDDVNPAMVAVTREAEHCQLSAYASERENVVLWWAGVGQPSGDYTVLGNPDLDFAERRGLLDLWGRVDAKGDWRWDGKGRPTDDHANSITKMRAYVDASRYRQVVAYGE